MKCSQCGHENLNDMRFCVKCGARLARYCAMCGAPMKPGAAFCAMCGKAVPAAASAEESVPPVIAEEAPIPPTASEVPSSMDVEVFASPPSAVPGNVPSMVDAASTGRPITFPGAVQSKKKGIPGWGIALIAAGAALLLFGVSLAAFPDVYGLGVKSTEAQEDNLAEQNKPVESPKETAEETAEATETAASVPATPAVSATPAPVDIDAIYRDYVRNTLLPEYGLADHDLIDSYLSQEYWDDMSGAAGLFNVYIDDLDDNGADDLLALIVEKDGLTMTGRYYTYDDGEVAEQAGDVMSFPAIDAMPIIDVMLGVVTMDGSKYLLYSKNIADGNDITTYAAFGFEDGAPRQLLDLIFYDDTGNAYDQYVACRLGPDALMSKNRKTGVVMSETTIDYAELDNLDDFYDRGEFLMYYLCVGEEFDHDDFAINDLYPNAMDAVNDALGYFGVSHDRDAYVFSAVKGAKLLPLITGTVNDQTSWQDWLENE
jgi:hypothetical protein